MHNYPTQLEIAPLNKPPQIAVSVPGSKSITNRALVLAALASRETECLLTDVLQSEDTEVMVNCLKKLGFRVECRWKTNSIVLSKHDSQNLIPASEADLFVGNSGTTIRFLTAFVSFGIGPYRLDGISRMRERPIGDMLESLKQIGVDAQSEAKNGCPPVIIEMIGEIKGHASLRANLSSQFVSGLLMVLPYADEAVTLELLGTVVSEPYIKMTISMMEHWGFRVDLTKSNEYLVHLWNGNKHPNHYAIEPDASSASYFFAAAAITGGRVTVQGMKREMLQGDVKFVDLLEKMGCRVEECDTGITVHGRKLKGIDCDMNAISDTVMTLSAVACFADGPTTIRNVAHIRHKETDRISAVATELRKLGVEVEEFIDGLKITPRPMTGCSLDTYNDHRMAMSLALIGLKVPGVIIKNPGCVAKTYPGFWQDFEKLRN